MAEKETDAERILRLAREADQKASEQVADELLWEIEDD